MSNIIYVLCRGMDITSYKLLSIFGILLSHMRANINNAQMYLHNNFMLTFQICMAWHIQNEFYICFLALRIWLIAIQSFFCMYLVQSCPVIVCHVQGLSLTQSMEVFQVWSVVLIFYCQQHLLLKSSCIVLDTRIPTYIILPSL